MYVSCAGVTLEKLGRISNAGSAFFLDVDGLLSSELTGGVVAGFASSSVFISASTSPSCFVSYAKLVRHQWKIKQTYQIHCFALCSSLSFLSCFDFRCRR